MIKNIHKIIFPLLFLLLILVAIFFVVWRAGDSKNELSVSFLDVGQGDAILIQTPYRQNILVDTGEDSKVILELSKKLPSWDRNIDLLIITHPHADHIGGAPEVLQRFRVKKVVYTGVIHSSSEYLRFLSMVRDQKIPMNIIDRPQKINFGPDCYLDIIYPLRNLSGQSVVNLNNTSIVSKLVYGETSFLLMGDAEQEVELELLSSKSDLQADVLKAGHHGSDTSSHLEFISAVQAQSVVFEAGKDNDFGHPSLRVLKRFKKTGADIFRTDHDGTINFYSNGSKVYVEGEK